MTCHLLLVGEEARGSREGLKGGSKERGRNATVKTSRSSLGHAALQLYHYRQNITAPEDRPLLQVSAAIEGNNRPRKKCMHLSLLEESNEEGSVQRVVVVHACVGCCRVEVRVPRHLQSCKQCTSWDPTRPRTQT